MKRRNKVIFAPFILFLLSISSLSRGEEKVMSAGETKAWIKKVFASVVEDMDAKEETYRKYFAENYVQHVDGKTLKLDDFIEHMNAQKKAVQRLKVNFKYITVEGNDVATVHIVEGMKKDGSPVKVQVNAFFRIQGEKIVLCDELTYVAKGSKEDADLGSRK